MPVIGERYSCHLDGSRVCERDCGSEVSRARVSPFREGSPAISSVRSMTSSVGVAAAGDTDFIEGPALCLGCDFFFSSSSEEMTYIIRDGILRRPSTGYTTMNIRQVDQETVGSGIANNARWRI